MRKRADSHKSRARFCQVPDRFCRVPAIRHSAKPVSLKMQKLVAKCWLRGHLANSSFAECQAREHSAKHLFLNHFLLPLFFSAYFQNLLQHTLEIPCQIYLTTHIQKITKLTIISCSFSSSSIYTSAKK